MPQELVGGTNFNVRLKKLLNHRYFSEFRGGSIAI